MESHPRSTERFRVGSLDLAGGAWPAKLYGDWTASEAALTSWARFYEPELVILYRVPTFKVEDLERVFNRYGVPIQRPDDRYSDLILVDYFFSLEGQDGLDVPGYKLAISGAELVVRTLDLNKVPDDFAVDSPTIFGCLMDGEDHYKGKKRLARQGCRSVFTSGTFDVFVSPHFNVTAEDAGLDEDARQVRPRLCELEWRRTGGEGGSGVPAKLSMPPSEGTGAIAENFPWSKVEEQ